MMKKIESPYLSSTGSNKFIEFILEYRVFRIFNIGILT